MILAAMKLQTLERAPMSPSKMKIRDRLVGCCGVLVFILLPIHGTMAQTIVDDSTRARDAAQFAAVIRAIVDSTAKPIRISADPLLGHPNITDATRRSYGPNDARISAARFREIRRAGLDTVAVATIEQCPGRLVPSDSVTRSGCPSRPETLVAVGTARVGGAYWSGGPYDDRESGRQAGHMVMRVIENSLDKGGSVITVADYVLAVRGGRWVVLKRVPLIYLH